MTDTITEDLMESQSDPSPAAEAADHPRGRLRDVVRRPVLLSLGVVVLAAAVMAVGLVAWWRADHDDRIDLAGTRDTVLVVATRNIETMNTLDYSQVDAGLAAWSKVTTGTLHDQIAQVTADDRKLLADQQKVSTGKVVAAAVTAVDATKASVVASVEVTVRDGADPSAEPTVKRNRFSADLVLVHGSWLLERLDQVAVNVS